MTPAQAIGAAKSSQEIVAISLFGGVNFDLLGDLRTPGLAHPSIPLPLSLDDVGLPC